MLSSKPTLTLNPVFLLSLLVKPLGKKMRSQDSLLIESAVKQLFPAMTRSSRGRP